jgi:hypothetical protein
MLVEACPSELLAELDTFARYVRIAELALT